MVIHGGKWLILVNHGDMMVIQHLVYGMMAIRHDDGDVDIEVGATMIVISTNKR